MTRLLPWLRRATALATLVAAALLCWQCIDIYLTGNRPENFDDSGVRIVQMYTREDVASRLTLLSVPLGICAALAAVTAVLGLAKPAAREGIGPKSARRLSRKAQRQPALPVGALRIGLYAAAIAFIVLGVMNGGLYDVLVKAIMICTECIGLG